MDKFEIKRDRTIDMSIRKEKKAQFNTDLNKNEKEEIDKVLKEHGISKATFVREAFENLKEELKMVKYIIVYKSASNEIDKYSNDDIIKKEFNTLTAAQEELDSLPYSMWPDEIINKLPNKILAMLYKVKINNDGDEEWKKIKNKIFKTKQD